MYISTPPSPEVENFQMKIYYLAQDRTPDLLNQMQTCYHLSQRGEHNNIKLIKDIIFPKDLNAWEKIYIQKNKFNIMSFYIPVENSLITKYLHPLIEVRHGNFNSIHTNFHRGQAGEHQK